MSSVVHNNHASEYLELSPPIHQQKIFSSYAMHNPFSQASSQAVDLAESYNDVTSSYDGPSNYIKKLNANIRTEGVSRLCASAYLPSILRSSTNLLDRISRSRTGTENRSFVKLRQGSFISPKIVKAIPKEMIKFCAGFQQPKGAKNRLQKKVAKVINEVSQIYKAKFIQRRTCSDLYLDNYRQRASSPITAEEKAAKFPNHYYAKSASKSSKVSERYYSPVKIMSQANHTKGIGNEYRIKAGLDKVCKL